jgi:hypothetical protein
MLNSFRGDEPMGSDGDSIEQMFYTVNALQAEESENFIAE